MTNRVLATTLIDRLVTSGEVVQPAGTVTVSLCVIGMQPADLANPQAALVYAIELLVHGGAPPDQGRWVRIAQGAWQGGGPTPAALTFQSRPGITVRATIGLGQVNGQLGAPVSAGLAFTFA
jgi:hypothetical protein